MNSRVSKVIAIGILASMLSACTQFDSSLTDKLNEKSVSEPAVSKSSTPEAHTVTVTASETVNISSDKNSGTSEQSGHSEQSTRSGDGVLGLVRRYTNSEGHNKAIFPVSEYRRFTAVSNRASVELPTWMEQVSDGHKDKESSIVDGTTFAAENQELFVAVVDDWEISKEELLAHLEKHLNETGATVSDKSITSRGVFLRGRQGVDLFCVMAVPRGDEVVMAGWVYPVWLMLEMDPVIVRFFKTFAVS